MNQSEQLLFDRISKLSFDDGNEELTFALRLARDNAWTHAYTARVIDEYKRFAFLAIVANHPVTPSDQVDQAWHLHLTYTRSYWDRFCGQVLGTPLHHGPTRGGPQESDKFDRWYQKTLKSYRRFFGHEPPAEIWPDASIRFGQDLHFQRINTTQHWVIPKPRLVGAAKNMVLGLLLIFIFVVSVVTIPPLLGVGDHSSIFGGTQTFEANASAPVNAILLAKQDPLMVLGYLLFAIAALGYGYFQFYNSKRCPKCKQAWALTPTGKIVRRLARGNRYEVICQNCGDRHLKTSRSSGGGGGGGCAGD